MTTRRGLAVAGTLLVVAAAVAATRTTLAPGDRAPRRAPELVGISHWINGPPVTIGSLRGHVVIVDFWTYSCVNCVRTFPGLRALYEHYRAAGLRIVGVHSPEFAFERDVANVRAAVRRHAIPYPVALDDDMETWRAYGNRYWPRHYVIDARGIIRADFIGEGHEEDLERSVRDLLREAGAMLPPDLALDERVPAGNITPEIYAGAERGGALGALASREGYERSGNVVTYAEPTREEIEAAGLAGAFFLVGAWRAHDEFIEAAEDGARVIVPFYAQDAFVVAAPPRGRAGTLVVTTAEDGRASAERVVGIDLPDLATLASFSRPERRVATVRVEAGTRIYSFTFG